MLQEHNKWRILEQRFKSDRHDFSTIKVDKML